MSGSGTTVKVIKNYFKYLWIKAAELNNENLISTIEPAKKAKILDIGTHNGTWIINRLGNIQKPEVHGIDIRPEAVSASKKLGIKAIRWDANNGLPYKANFFDVVFANQIIEHVVNVDLLVEETFRVLKPKGYLVISTENLSAWHNIFALCLGWQAFSQTISTKKNVGNPLRLGNMENYESSGVHIKILTLRGLRELIELYGFRVEKTYGAGHYPFPPLISKLLSQLDPSHAAFIGLKARKIKGKNNRVQKISK